MIELILHRRHADQREPLVRGNGAPDWAPQAKGATGTGGATVEGLRLRGNVVGNPGARGQSGLVLGDDPRGQHWILRDLDVRDQSHAGVYLDSWVTAEVEGLTGSGCGAGELLSVGASQDVTVRGSTGIYVNREPKRIGGASRWRIEDCDLRALEVSHLEADYTWIERTAIQPFGTLLLAPGPGEIHVADCNLSGATHRAEIRQPSGVRFVRCRLPETTVTGDGGRLYLESVHLDGALRARGAVDVFLFRRLWAPPMGPAIEATPSGDPEAPTVVRILRPQGVVATLAAGQSWRPE